MDRPPTPRAEGGGKREGGGGGGRKEGGSGATTCDILASIKTVRVEVEKEGMQAQCEGSKAT